MAGTGKRHRGLGKNFAMVVPPRSRILVGIFPRPGKRRPMRRGGGEGKLRREAGRVVRGRKTVLVRGNRTERPRRKLSRVNAPGQRGPIPLSPNPSFLMQRKIQGPINNSRRTNTINGPGPRPVQRNICRRYKPSEKPQVTAKSATVQARGGRQ